MSEKSDPSNRLADLLGFDPRKKSLPITAKVMAEVAEELRTERAEQAKAKARDLFREAVKIQEEFVQTEKAFNKAREKFLKTLGSILGQIERTVDPAPSDPPALSVVTDSEPKE